MKFHVIIPASGSGERFRSRIPKQFVKLFGKELITYTIRKFNSINSVESIVIATNKEYFKRLQKIIKGNEFHKVSNIVLGGATRHDSVFNGLRAIIPTDDCYVIIHDAVRPFITQKKIKEMMKVVKDCKAVIPGLKINDTIKEVNNSNIVKRTVPRKYLWEVQTPQIFKYDILWKSFEKANSKKFKGTDESSIVENAGYKVKIIEGEKANIKVTTKDDLKQFDINKFL